MNESDTIDFFAYLDEASQAVSTWPTWKQEGSDATCFQSNTQEDSRQNIYENLATME
ncbi:hypothetical protein LW347_20960 [Pectobacterium polonicum]|uniref:Uncharacterized protein n=1 Tax=Pectobacterium polonicum TaxID=2485124 RepID=A0AAE9NPZ5_9GAMM|nr:hypothetical protein [Pectobacterium polonicum]UVO08269.1 hypothetical protein LW347_20960 [Pectobacterium polonicum]